MNQKQELQELIAHLKKIIVNHKDDVLEFHPYDIAKDLQTIRDLDPNEYKSICKEIPSDLFAQIIINMPTYIQEELTSIISKDKVANVTSIMESDDASLLIYNISKNNEAAAAEVLSKLKDDHKQVIEELNAYDENEAGAFMQKELFSVNINENIGDALKRLKVKKDLKLLNNIFHAFIIIIYNKCMKTIE